MNGGLSSEIRRWPKSAHDFTKVRYLLDLSAARGRERISATFALSVGRFPCRYALRSGSLSFPPKGLVVHCKGWDTEHPGLNCTFRLKTKPSFDFNRLGLAQKLLSIEADAISNLANDRIRGDISSLTPSNIKKSHRQAFSKTIIVECRRDTKSFERIKGMCWGTLNFNPRWMAQRCVSRIV